MSDLERLLRLDERRVGPRSVRVTEESVARLIRVGARGDRAA